MCQPCQFTIVFLAFEYLICLLFCCYKYYWDEHFVQAIFSYAFICLGRIPQSRTTESEVGSYYQPCSVFPDFSIKAFGNVRIYSCFP